MKTFKVSVTRTSTTDIYVQVPDGVDAVHLLHSRHAKELGRIAFETTTDDDWDDYGWEDSVEATSVVRVTEKEASDYGVGELREVTQ